MKRFFYLSLVVAALLCFSSCHKEPKNSNNSGNVTGNQNGVDPPSNSTDGVVFTNSGKSAIFNLYAPGKKSVAVIGEFNNWQPAAMKNSKDGTRWWVQVDNLDPTKQYAYQYLIDGNLKVADPYTNEVLDPNNDSGIPSSVYPNLKPYPSGGSGIVSTFWYGAPSYTWSVSNFQRPDPNKLVVYELLVRDFVATHSYKTIADTLNYLVRLGVNAIELLPVNEFEGNDSWGYNSNFMFALDKYYGTPNDYKAFIDACHSRGIAVIQDIVLEDQFGSSPLCQMYWNSAANQPAADNPWLDQTNMHPAAVGYQMNHQSQATQNFTENVMKYWMQEYHIDGFRFDEAKGYTQTNSGGDYNAWAAYDPSRVALWEKYNSYMKSLDPSFYVILEMFSANNEEEEYAKQGMMCWANLSTNGEQALMSYNDSGGPWDLTGLFYNSSWWNFTVPTGNICYFESHDQERLQFKNEQYGNSSGSYNIKDLATGLKRDEMGAAFMFSSPGPKMVWQFGERGYDISNADNSPGGRLGDKPPHWEYMSDPNRAHLYKVYSQMIKMKIKNAVFNTTTYSYNLTGAYKFIQLVGSDGTDVEVVGNFNVTPMQVIINFPATGTWTDNIDGSSITTATTAYTTTLAPGEYHVYSNKPLQQ
ncbi:MAG TPA: alpha-amylase family glycosyl hydrolase [Mucilaginibacter sp.]|nr:alpha-amylase family glycosyl hydrolase [Mucilaginibacter sp.]